MGIGGIIVETTRRDFLKRAAIGGAVVWSAPTITTLTGPRAWADHYAGVCDAEATGLRVRLGDDTLLDLGHAERVQDGEVCTVRVGRIDENPDGSFTFKSVSVLGLFRIAAELACGQIFSEDGRCRALARVVDLVLVFGGDGEDDDDDGLIGGIQLGLADGLTDHHGPRAKTVIRIQLLRAEATGSIGDPNADTTGNSLVAKVTVNDEPPKHLRAQADCNFNVDILGLVRLIFNEQFCKDGKLVVRALRVEVPASDHGLLEVVGAEVKVRGAGDCVACS